MNTNQLKDFIKLKNLANKIDKQIGVLEKITRENLTDLQPLVLPIILNGQYNFYQTLQYLKQEDKLDLLFDNLDSIHELKCTIALYSFLLEQNIHNERLEYLKTKIKFQLDNNETINDYFLENLLIYCNHNNLNLFNYVKNIKNDNTCSNVEVCFNLEKSSELFSMNKRDPYHYLNFTIDNSTFDLNNDIHLKNIFIFITKKGWSSDRNFDKNNKEFLSKLIPLNELNLLETFNRLNLDFKYANFIYQTKENRLRYQKEEIARYNSQFFYEIFSNNIMSIEDILEFFNHTCSTQITSDRIEVEMIYISKNIEHKLLTKYPNILNRLVDSYFIQEKEHKNWSKREKWVSMYEYEEIKNICAEITLETGLDKQTEYLDCITYHIDITKPPFKQLTLEKMSKNSNLIDIIESLKVLNHFNNKDIHKHLTDIVSLETLFGYFQMKDYSLLRYFELNQEVSSYIKDCDNILNVIFEKLIESNNVDYMKIYIDCFNTHSFEESDLVISWLKDNYSLLNDIKSTEFLEFKLKHNLISQNEFDNHIVDLVISNEYLRDLSKIEDINIFFNKNTNIKNEWIVRWTYWKSFENCKNFYSLDNDTYIFDFMEKNYLTLFSSEYVIKKMLKEPWSSYDDKVSQKQIDFLNKMIEHFGNFEMFNVIKEIAVDFSIKINPKIKENFFYTENSLEDIFEV